MKQVSRFLLAHFKLNELAHFKRTAIPALANRCPIVSSPSGWSPSGCMRNARSMNMTRSMLCLHVGQRRFSVDSWAAFLYWSMQYKWKTQPHTNAVNSVPSSRVCRQIVQIGSSFALSPLVVSPVSSGSIFVPSAIAAATAGMSASTLAMAAARKMCLKQKNGCGIHAELVDDR